MLPVLLLGPLFAKSTMIYGSKSNQFFENLVEFVHKAKTFCRFFTKYVMNKIAIVSTMLPRLELDFIDEWSKYHSFIVDEINIFYDPRENLADGTKVWYKKPFGNYHLEKSHDEIMEQFKSICAKYPKVNLRKSGNYPHVVGSQSHNLLTGIYSTDANFIFHIDCDEFLKIDDYSIFDDQDHIGIQQQIMDLRWKNKKSVLNVKDIVNGKESVKAVGSFGCKIWKSCWYKEKFTQSILRNKVEPKILNHHGFLVSNIADNLKIKIFHYVGWNYRQDEKHWKNFKSIQTDEFQKHFEKIVFPDMKLF